MATYWLLDSIHKSERDTPSSARDWKLPGETESVHGSGSVTSRTGQGGSRHNKLQHQSKPSLAATSDYRSISPEKVHPSQSFNFDEHYGY